MSEVRFEVSHVNFAQHRFFLPLPHMPGGIQNAAATSKKQKTPACIRGIQVHKLWTKVYPQKGLAAAAAGPQFDTASALLSLQKLQSADPVM